MVDIRGEFNSSIKLVVPCRIVGKGTNGIALFRRE